MTIFLFCFYMLIGTCFAIDRKYDIAASVPVPGDIQSTVVTLLKWIITWPWWAFKK